MNRFVLSFLMAVSFIAAASVVPVFSQESTGAEQETASQPVREEAQAAKDMSVYGEVQAVNPAANTISVQYYDYDSDQEKTADVVADKDTKIENAASLDKIAKGDWVDVTYAVKDSKNIAKSIIVEKEEPETPVSENVSSEAPMEE